MSVLWSAVNRSPNCRAGGRPSGSGIVPALQGALVIFVILHISQSGSAGKCVYRLCRALGAFAYFDFTKRCFLRSQAFFLTFFLGFGLASDDDDEEDDDAVVVDSWLLDGEGNTSFSASAEGRPPQSGGQDRSWQELARVDSSDFGFSFSSDWEVKIIGTSW